MHVAYIYGGIITIKNHDSNALKCFLFVCYQNTFENRYLKVDVSVISTVGNLTFKIECIQKCFNNFSFLR